MYTGVSGTSFYFSTEAEERESQDTQWNPVSRNLKKKLNNPLFMCLFLCGCFHLHLLWTFVFNSKILFRFFYFHFFLCQWLMSQIHLSSRPFSFIFFIHHLPNSSTLESQRCSIYISKFDLLQLLLILSASHLFPSVWYKADNMWYTLQQLRANNLWETSSALTLPSSAFWKLQGL